MDEYDIIIVGAGPAGLIAGLYAVGNGCDAEVLIVDKKTEIGIPVRCGEATVATIFQDFGIKPTKDIVANEVNATKLYSSLGKKIEMTIQLNGYILNRDKFEQHLANQAKEKGVKIQLGTTVVGLSNDKIKITRDNGRTIKTIKAKIIIAADGVESRIGRWAGIDTTLIPKDIAICQQYFLTNIDLDKSAVEFYWGSKYSPHAYTWVFPKSDTSANVGIVSFGSLNLDLNKYLNKFINIRAPKSKKRNLISGCIPQAKPPAQVVKDNIMLVGDAARVALPVTGAGIGNALLTGKWCGEVAGKVIRNDLDIDQLKEYEINFKKIRRKFKGSYRFKEKVLKDDGFYEILFAIAKPLPFIYKFYPDIFHRFLLKNIRY
jgi:digeranylgeranylglycerophospholipid reductase